MKDEAQLNHDSCHGDFVVTTLMACVLQFLLIICRPNFRPIVGNRGQSHIILSVFFKGTQNKWRTSLLSHFQALMNGSLCQAKDTASALIAFIYQHRERDLMRNKRDRKGKSCFRSKALSCVGKLYSDRLM